MLAVAPGRMHVACLDPYRKDPGRNSSYRSIEVVDDEGVYVDATMSCESAQGVGMSTPSHSLGTEPVEAARSFLIGLEPDDELTKVGYVERSSEARVAVRRDDEVVAGPDPGPRKGRMGVERLRELPRSWYLVTSARADAIGSFFGTPMTQAFAELLIDCEEDRTLRAVLLGMLREAERFGSSRTDLQRVAFPRGCRELLLRSGCPGLGVHRLLANATRCRVGTRSQSVAGLF